ncbi:MAG: kynureninase [Flavisolibacter sp.]
MEFEKSLEFAQLMDKTDALKAFRSEFILPPFKDKHAIYFLGNSLGLQPKQTTNFLNEVLGQWAHLGVEGFFKGNNPWLDYHQQLIEPLAGIVGSLPHEIVVMNQLTVNLHLMLVSFYRPQGRRKKILCEAKAFPSDQYMLETHLKKLGLDPREIIIEVSPRPGQWFIDQEDIINAIEENQEELALVFWGGVSYYTGQAFDIASITLKAKQAGAMAGFDLAHAAGNIALQLHNWNVDFACWCSYKYLNSGPGAIGGVYIHEQYHKDALINRFGGWWGYKTEKRFLMEEGFDPIDTAEGWQLSTPSILLYASHKAALNIFSRAGMNNIIHKGQLLSDYLIFLLNQIQIKFSNNIMRILTPQRKGCQVSMIIENGKSVYDRLTENGIFADWRQPDVIRVAPVPLYNSFEEIWRFAQILDLAIKYN